MKKLLLILSFVSCKLFPGGVMGRLFPVQHVPAPSRRVGDNPQILPHNPTLAQVEAAQIRTENRESYRAALAEEFSTLSSVELNERRVAAERDPIDDGIEDDTGGVVQAAVLQEMINRTCGLSLEQRVLVNISAMSWQEGNQTPDELIARLKRDNDQAD